MMPLCPLYLIFGLVIWATLASMCSPKLAPIASPPQLSTSKANENTRLDSQMTEEFIKQLEFVESISFSIADLTHTDNDNKGTLKSNIGQYGISAFEARSPLLRRAYSRKLATPTDVSGDPTAAYNGESIYLVVIIEFVVLFAIVTVIVVNIFRKNIKSRRISDSYFDVNSNSHLPPESADNNSYSSLPSSRTHISTVGAAPFPVPRVGHKKYSVRRHISDTSRNSQVNEIRTIKSFFRKIITFQFRPSRWFMKVYNIIMNNNSVIGKIYKDNSNSSYWMEMLVLMVLTMFISVVVTTVVSPDDAITYCQGLITKASCLDQSSQAKAISFTYISFGDYLNERCAWSDNKCTYDIPQWDVIIVIKYSLIVSAVSFILIEIMREFPAKFQILLRWIFARFLFSLCFSIDFETSPSGPSSLRIVYDLICHVFSRICRKCRSICVKQNDEVDIIYDPNVEPTAPLQAQFYFDEFATLADVSMKLKMLRACRLTQLRSIDNLDSLHSILMISNEITNLNKKIAVRKMTSGIGNLEKLKARNVYLDPVFSWEHVGLKSLPITAFYKENKNANGDTVSYILKNSKHESHRIRDRIDNMDDANSKEEFLLLSFMVNCLPYRQQKLGKSLVFNKWNYLCKDNFLSSLKVENQSAPSSNNSAGGSFTFETDPYAAAAVEIPQFTLRFLIELAFFGAVLLVIFIEGLTFSDDASYAWCVLYFSSIFFSLFIYPTIYSLLEFLFHYQTISRLTEIAIFLERYSKILLIRSRGLIVTNTNGNRSIKSCNNSLLQHTNPACRACRTFPKLPISRLLMSINDSDISFESINYSNSSSFVSYFLLFIYYIKDFIISFYNLIYFLLSLLPMTALNSLLKILTAVFFYIWILVLNYLYFISPLYTALALLLCFTLPFYDIISFSIAQFVVKSMAKTHKRMLDSRMNIIKDKGASSGAVGRRIVANAGEDEDPNETKKLVMKWLFGDRQSAGESLVAQTASSKAQRKIDDAPTTMPPNAVHLGTASINDEKWDDESSINSVNEGNTSIQSISKGGIFNKVLDETSAAVSNIKDIITMAHTLRQEHVRERHYRDTIERGEIHSDMSDSEDENFRKNDVNSRFTRVKKIELITGVPQYVQNYNEGDDDDSFYEHMSRAEQIQATAALNRGDPNANPKPFELRPVKDVNKDGLEQLPQREFPEAGGALISNAFERRQEYFSFAKNRPAFQSPKGATIISHDISDFSAQQLVEVKSSLFHDTFDDASVGSQDTGDSDYWSRQFSRNDARSGVDGDASVNRSNSPGYSIDRMDASRPSSPEQHVPTPVGLSSIVSTALDSTAAPVEDREDGAEPTDAASVRTNHTNESGLDPNGKKIPKVEVSKHPKYSKYFTMLSTGLPKPLVLKKFQQDWQIDHSKVNAEQILNLNPKYKVIDETRLDENGCLVGPEDEEELPDAEELERRRLKKELDERRAEFEKEYDRRLKANPIEKAPRSRYYNDWSRADFIFERRIKPVSLAGAIEKLDPDLDAHIINVMSGLYIGKDDNGVRSIIQDNHAEVINKAENKNDGNVNKELNGGSVSGSLLGGSLVEGGSLDGGPSVVSIENIHRGLPIVTTYLVGKRLNQYSLEDGPIELPEEKADQSDSNQSLDLAQAKTHNYSVEALEAVSGYFPDGNFVTNVDIERYRSRVIKDKKLKKERNSKHNVDLRGNIIHLNLYNISSSIRKLRQSNNEMNLKQGIDKEGIKIVSTVNENWNYFNNHVVFSLPVVEFPIKGFKQKYWRKKTLKKNRKFTLLTQFPGFRIPKIKFDNIGVKDFYGTDKDVYDIDNQQSMDSDAFSTSSPKKERANVQGTNASKSDILAARNDENLKGLTRDRRIQATLVERCNRNEGPLNSFLYFDADNPDLGKDANGVNLPLDLNFTDAISFEDDAFEVEETPSIKENKTNHNTRMNCKPVYRKIEYSSRYSKYWWVNKQKAADEKLEEQFGKLSEEDLAMIEFEKAQQAMMRSQSTASNATEQTIPVATDFSSDIDPVLPKFGFVHFSMNGVDNSRPRNIDTRKAPLLLSSGDPRPMAPVMSLRGI